MLEKYPFIALCAFLAFLAFVTVIIVGIPYYL